MGGFTQPRQVFATITEPSIGLTEPPVSGILGLAWSSIASTNATPFWENQAQEGDESTAEFGFFLARYADNATATADEQDGGEFSFGSVIQCLP